MLENLKNMKRIKINTISGILGVILYFSIPLIATNIHGNSAVVFETDYHLYITGGVILLSLIIDILDHSGRKRVWNSVLYIGLYIYFIVGHHVKVTILKFSGEGYNTYALETELNNVAGWLIFLSIVIWVYVLTNFVSSGTYLSKGSINARGGAIKAKMAIAISRMGRRY